MRSFTTVVSYPHAMGTDSAAQRHPPQNREPTHRRAQRHRTAPDLPADGPPQPWHRSPTARAITAALLIVGAVMIAHGPVLRAGALCFDDPEYLTENPLVKNPSLHSAWRFTSEVLEPSTVHGYYQPLTMISLMVDYAMGGRPDHLSPFHRTSLLLHTANALLVALILYQLLGDGLIAVAVAILFGVHPMAVETMAWVGERKTVLATFFVLLSIVSYIKHSRGGHWRWYAASLTCFTIGLLAKPTVTPLPACLILLDFWPLRRLSRRAIIEKLPYFAIAAISAVITYESQRRTAVTVLPVDQDAARIPYVVCHNIIFYLRNMLWPVGLSSNYTFPLDVNMSTPAVAAGAIGTAILLSALAVSLRWTRALATGWLFFFVAIFPTLGVVGFTNVIAADKYAYWPTLGLLLALAWILQHVRGIAPDRRTRPRATAPGRNAERIALRAGGPPPSEVGEPTIIATVSSAPPRLKTRGTQLRLLPFCLFTCVALAAILLTAGTRSYLQRWMTTEMLGRYMVSLDEKAAAPLILLGLDLQHQGKTTEAIPILQRAAAAAPLYEGTFYNLAISLDKAGRRREAIACYRQAIALKPDFAAAYNNLGSVLLAENDLAGARDAYRQAITLQPNQTDAHYNLANVLARMGDIPAAIGEYEQAIHLQPNHAAAQKNMAIILWDAGRRTEALQHYEQALQIRPDDWRLAVYLADLFANSDDPQLRQPERAAQAAQTALRAAQATGDPALIEEVRDRVERYLTAGASQIAPLPR